MLIKKRLSTCNCFNPVHFATLNADFAKHLPVGPRLLIIIVEICVGALPFRERCYGHG
jgi:hypothetical protein